MKFTLPISPEYVGHWGLWEAVREIYQNALDAHDQDPECISSIRYTNDGESLHISTTKGQLTPSTLVLGNTSKRDAENQRGKFGEGYKLALLVLARLGVQVEVFTGYDVWDAKLERDENFDSTVLNIYTRPRSSWTGEGVEFVLYGIKKDQWETICTNLCADPSYNRILDAPDQKGRVYVGGLYVATVPEFHYGYSFKPGQIKLDRDRSMVASFDLAWETSQLWAVRTDDKVAELLKAEAPDIEYLEQNTSATSPAVLSYYHHYTAMHGAAVPVSTQDEVERATAAGLKWVLVSSAVKTLLNKVVSYFIPTSKSPLEQLKAFKQKWEWHFTQEQKIDFNAILKSMEPHDKNRTA